MLFLALYTRRFERPVSCVVKGPSGSGKSFALESALKFVPADTYQYFAGMSEKAIVYSGMDLRHKHLVIGEAAGLASGDGRAFLRQLLSEGTVRYMTVQKTDKGLTGKELPTVQGPCGLIMTTTANSLHPEDESRMLSLNIRESTDQIRAALLAQALGSRPNQGPDFTRWHEFDRLIGSGSVSVAIPFAASIARALPLTHHRVQRDFPQVLSLISSHALMHKCIRQRNESGEIVATLEDYEEVYDLVNGPLSEGLELAVPVHIRELVEAVSTMVNSTGDYDPFTNGVTQSTLAEVLKKDQSSVSRSVQKSIELGYLKNQNPGQGRDASIILGERRLPHGYALPCPKDLNQLVP